MNKKVSDVRITTDYSMFKFDPLNRSIKKSKLEKLRPSIARTKGNLQSVLVDKDGNIIDGQHRYVVCKSLGLPVRYEVQEAGYTATDIIDINNYSSGWTVSDFAEHYAKKGDSNYQIFMKYRQQYPEIKEGVLCSILENKYTLKNSDTGSMRKRGFQSGTFVVMQEPKAKLFLQKLKEIGTFYKGWNKRSFVYALIHLSNQKDFDWDKFISKLQIRHVSLFDFPKAEDFVKVLIDIYNYRERNKINFNL